MTVLRSRALGMTALVLFASCLLSLERTTIAFSAEIEERQDDTTNENSLARLRKNRRRALDAVKDVADPRSVSLKDQVASLVGPHGNQRAVPFEGSVELGHTRPLRILAVGTSFTWAHGITDRSQAYPYQLTTHPEYVDNIALPATGADYDAICIETMIPKEEDGVTTKNYDMIILEFSENQTDGLPFLAKRIRARYPHAVILYVHVWAFIGEATDPATGKFPFQIGLDPNIPWQWCDNTDGVGFYKLGEARMKACIREICTKEELVELIEGPEIHGTVYFFPLPESPRTVIDEKWLVEDWLHLSFVGHKKVAEGVVEFMKQHEDELYSEKPASDGTWNLGDTCIDWHYDKTLVEPIQYTGAEMKCRNNDPMNPDCSLEVEIDNPEGATVRFYSRFSQPVPVGIGYKSVQSPITYHKVSVSLNGAAGKVVDPEYNRSTRTAAAIRLKNSISHIGAHYKIGWAVPGENIIHIKTLPPPPPTDGEEQTPPLQPFRLTGVYMCGSCKDNPDGDFGMGSMNAELDALQPIA